MRGCHVVYTLLVLQSLCVLYYQCAPLEIRGSASSGNEKASQLLSSEDVCELGQCGGAKDKSDWTESYLFVDILPRWPHNNLTYAVHFGHRSFGLVKTRQIIRRAFNVWQESADITFTEIEPVSGETEDISLMFLSGDHSSVVKVPPYMETPFDGPGGVHAHAFYPDLGHVHFDEDEVFTDGTTEGLNLYQIAVHEIGHSLGLDHSTDMEAVMAPTYTKYDPNLSLHADDIAMIQELYGARQHGDSQAPPSTAQTSSQPPG